MEVVVNEGASSAGRLPDPAFWRATRVLVTGHTGFKGSWLCRWLVHLGAEVHGLALAPPTEPNLFNLLDFESSLRSDSRVDIRDRDAVAIAIRLLRPDIVFHLAAQPLVRRSYADPIETFSVNVIGTANVLDAVYHDGGVRAAVVVTSDKVYEPSSEPRHEDAPLGGHDPYSRSKAMAEGIVEVYRAMPPVNGISWVPAIATARAGNVIGGGDWGEDRLVPDCIRAFIAGKSVRLRFPAAVRPWQHVLEPLSGYLVLAEELAAHGQELVGAWNFGPAADGDLSVRDLAGAVASAWGDGAEVTEDSGESANPPETAVLRLDSARSRTNLAWRPRWSTSEAVDYAVGWYRAWSVGTDMTAVTDCQIAEYSDG